MKHELGRRTWLARLAVVAMALSACVAVAPAAQAQAPKRGGTMTFVNSADGDQNLDPATWGNLYALEGGAVGTRALAIFDTLLYEQNDGKIVPRLATSFVDKGNGRTWELHLRPGIKFSDGTPYDAQAVKFNWDRIKNPATRSPALGSASQIATMNVFDATTLKINLTEPNTQFDRVVALFLSAIQSPTAVQKAGAGFGTKVFPIGAGPFVIDSRILGSKLTLVRNPKYWDAPRPYLDKLVFRTIVDDSQRSNTFRSGAAQMNATLGWPQVVQEQKAGFPQFIVRAGGGRPIYLNNTAAPFNDKLARQALAAAFDQKKYVNTVQYGLGEQMESLFYRTSPFYKTSPKWPAADPGKAQKLLDQYASKHNGKPLSFTLLASVTIRAEAEYMQAILNQYRNIKVELNLAEPQTLTPAAIAKSYDAVVLNLVYVDPEPALAQQLLSTSARNFTGYKSADVDAALRAAKAPATLAQRQAAYKKVAEAFNADVPWIWSSRTSGYVSYAKSLAGVTNLENGAPIPWTLYFK